MSESTSGPDLFNMLADEFAERYRRGERPPLSEYTGKYPALAEQIRELFPALVAIEQFGTGAEQATGSFAVRPGAADPIPDRLGDYHILREIGRGGMGIVYEAVQESLGRHVALKVLPQNHLRDGTQLERFRREARAAAMLHHTNIVPVFGVGEHNGVHHYAMQYIKGQSLDAILHDVKRLRGAKPDDAACLPASGEDAGLAASVAIELVTGRFAGQGGAPAQTAAVPASDPPYPGEDSATHTEEPGSGLSSSASSIVSQTGTSYYQSVARIGVQAAEAARVCSSPQAATPRHQAVQPAFGPARDSLGDRFRTGQSRGNRRPDPDRRHCGHAAVHAPRAVSGPGRRAVRRVRARPDSVRNAHARAGVRGRGAGPADRQDPAREAPESTRARPPDPARSGDDHPEGDGARPLRPVPNGGGPGRGPASVPGRPADPGATGIGRGAGPEMVSAQPRSRGADPGERRRRPRHDRHDSRRLLQLGVTQGQ